MSQRSIAAVVLAAGRSVRMGRRNKLLLPLHGKPILQRVVEAVRTAGVDFIIVVLGHQADEIRSILPLDCHAVLNPHYVDGMGTSIACGVAAIPAGYRGALIIPGDMPLIDADLVRSLLRAVPTGETPHIVVPRFRERRGHPVYFSHHFFAELEDLRGDVGARGILRRHAAHVIEVESDDPAVIIDIDDMAQYSRILKSDPSKP